MQAIVYDRYGSFDVLAMREVAKPDVKDDDVLVRVTAAALHVGDCYAVRGAPFMMRLNTGLTKPKVGIPGFDLAGRVETVGDNVTRFKPGDEVFGASLGTCAEYVTAGSDQLALKPPCLSFEEAAAIPTSGLAALQGLRDAAKLQPQQHVLVIGASGGVGSFATQIAKALGAHVTAVCSGGNADLVRSIGADRVIDYTLEDFANGSAKYDVIFDNIENRSLADCRRALTRTGTLVLNSGTGASGVAMMGRLVKPLVVSPFVRQKLCRFLSHARHDDLVALGDLAESNKLRPLIDKTFPLRETPEALSYIARGHARGKVVVTV